MAPASHADHDRHRRARRVRRLPRRPARAGPAGTPSAEVLACSSAGGGLRIAVVGNEELVTAEAGRRVALSSGGRVVAVLAVLARRRPARWSTRAAGRRAADRRHRRRQRRAIVDAGRGLARAAVGGPVVVAGNVDARPEVEAALDGRDAVRRRRQRGAPDRRAGAGSARARDPRDVPVPRDRRQAPQQAPRSSSLHGDGRAARHPTWCSPAWSCWPEARGDRPGAGDVVVVDVGGATTDVHSVVELDPEDGRTALARGRRHDTGDPHGRGRPRDAVVAPPRRVAAADLAEPDRGGRGRGTPTPAFLPDDRGRVRRGRGHRRPRPSASPCAGTPAAARSSSAPTVAWSSVPARTCARSTSARRVRRGAAPRPTRRRRAGAGRQHRRGRGWLAAAARDRGSSSTTTTCWPRAGCWPRVTRRRRTGSCSDWRRAALARHPHGGSLGGAALACPRGQRR